MHLKPNSVVEFTQRLEKDILPLLRKQRGFQDEITFVAQDGREAFGISLWDKAENAEAYNRRTYPETTKFLITVVEGTPPRVETYDVANSTFHKIAALPEASTSFAHWGEPGFAPVPKMCRKDSESIGCRYLLPCR